jgi:hypothetical protein
LVAPGARDKLGLVGAPDDNSSSEPCSKQDVLFVHSPAPTGDGFRVIRARNDTLELGELRGMKAGQPIYGEVVQLSRREESPRMFDVTTVVPPKTSPAEPGKGPAKVTTSAYRSGWEAVFGGKEPPGELN